MNFLRLHAPQEPADPVCRPHILEAWIVGQSVVEGEDLGPELELGREVQLGQEPLHFQGLTLHINDRLHDIPVSLVYLGHELPEIPLHLPAHEFLISGQRLLQDWNHHGAMSGVYLLR